MRSFSVALLLSLTACAGASRAATVEPLTAGGEPLRTAFNAAAGRVRAIFLASPT